ncbi:MAG: BamA/TamA family outer membrane protein [Flavobacteriaceae bacterium]|nr:BamA/TamA family outer membrane protein [Flavobacteriaceae bacterium]NNK72065.1 BamA/TamA family outer membrane protein [Flavobacteriaceae bacterium]
MKNPLIKILLFLILIGSFSSCNVVKRVGENEYLLTDTNVLVNGKKSNKEQINNLLYQRPNVKTLGIPLRLHIYNLARPKRDSLFEAWLDEKPRRRERMNNFYSKKQVDRLKESALGFNNWLKKTGERPTIIDSLRTRKSIKNLEDYHFVNGWFDRKVSHQIEPHGKKRAKITYSVETGKPYFIDSIRTKIASPVIDSLYQKLKKYSLLISQNQFKLRDFEMERDRLNKAFRNRGVYYFSEDYISFENDTIGKKEKIDVDLIIQNRIIRNDDSIARLPFKIYKIRDVNIITDDAFENRGKPFKDSISFKNYNLYSYDNFRYKPKALTDAVFIGKGRIFRDIDRTYTYRYLNELQTFKYPNIEYIENEEDTTLTANIYLSPRKKFGLGFDFDISQSNIQTVGLSFSTSLLTRNVFRGAETLEISALGSIGASKDGSNNDQQFFDINEIGANVKLTIPRFFFPVNTERIIPKFMSPSSRVSLGFTSQTNIGLDKQTVNGILNYRWYPSQNVTNGLDLFSAQYVRNLNPGNYFSVYQNSFSRLETIALDVYDTPAEFIDLVNGQEQLNQNLADEFIELVLADAAFQSSNPDDYQNVNNISQRKDRLTENNLILATNFSYSKDRRENVFDEDFSIFRFKVEFAGNLLSSISKLLGEQQNENGKYEFFNVAFSQYAKTEFDYIKHWDLGRKNILAMRSFFGIAIPYGNSTSIPFAKSFFAGGTNDNRAWTAYNLGPGSSDSNDEFNEANMKLALSMEYRFNLFAKLNGALFVDAGNIWNVFDDVDDDNATFDSFSSLKDIAVGAGFGIRYDFGFFVLRGDIGFKAYDPSYQDENRWFNEFNFSKAVYNIGINYPF